MIIVIGINTHEGNEMKTNNQTGSFNLELDAVLYPDAPDSFEDTESGELILDQNELHLPSVYFSLGDLKTAQYERVDDMNVIKLTTSSNNDFYFSVNDANKTKYVRYAETICDAIQQFNQEPKHSNRDTQSKSRAQNADSPNDDDSKADSKAHSKADKKTSSTTSKLLNHPYAKKVLGIIGGVIVIISISIFAYIYSDDYDPNNVPLNLDEALDYYYKHCKRNVADACKHFLLELHERDKRECEVLEKTCNLNIEFTPIACRRLGELYFLGKNCANQDYEKALKYTKIACNKGDAMGCSHVGHIIIDHTSKNKNNLTTKAISKKLSAAKDYLSKGCALGEATACTTLEMIE